MLQSTVKDPKLSLLEPILAISECTVFVTEAGHNDLSDVLSLLYKLLKQGLPIFPVHQMVELVELDVVGAEVLAMFGLR